MSKGTRLVYKGSQPTYAFKRECGQGTFITLEELFKLTGKQSGFSSPSIKFLEWFFNNRVSGLKNFELQIDKEDFNDDGSFKGITKEAVKKGPEKNYRPKSSQVVVEDDLSSEPSEKVIEAPNLEQAQQDNSGKVTVTSSEVQVTDSVQSATDALIEQAKSLHSPQDKKGHIVDNRPEPEIKVESSTVITGDDFKQNSDEASRAVVLHGKTPVGVEGVPENMKYANVENSKTFVLEPPVVPASQDVMQNPVVNYGGNATKLEEAKVESTAPQESVGNNNVMSQPAMTAVDNLKQPISLDTIVRNPSDAAAIEAVNKCRDWHMLKIAAKQLRNLGNKPKVEQAVQKRLGTLPPGSAG